LSDIFAFVLSFANRLKIDLSETLAAKMKNNAIKYPVRRSKGKYKVYRISATSKTKKI
jgi:NTP pyrophosphatase (non-canonical NTP hydrolase)